MSILDIDILQRDTSNVYIFTTRMSSRLVALLDDDYNFETCLRFLNDLKQSVTLQSITNHQLKCESLINLLFSRIVLNLVIHKVTGRTFDPWEPIPFTYNEYGKPLVSLDTNEGPKTLQFNSSTSNQILSIILELSPQNTPIGIDLSHTEQSSISSTEFMDQFAPMFSPREREQLLQLDVAERYTLFNHLWTLKEAFTKFLGCGLNIELADIDFVFGNMDISHYANHKQTDVYDEVLEITLQWFRDIEVDVSKLQAKRNRFLLALTNPNMYCHSSVLYEGSSINNKLPVIISFISQTQDPQIKVFELDFVKLLHLD